MRFTLVPSPFLGPWSWSPLCDALTGLGEIATVSDVCERLEHSPGAYARIGAAVAAHLSGPSILVAHSGASALLPSIVSAATQEVTGAILVDALLPHPGRSWFDTVPPKMAEQLRSAASQGLAPSWPTWLPDAALTELLPDLGQRAELRSRAPRIPVAFLEEVAPPVSIVLPPGLCAYIQLSAGYDLEANEARRLGWCFRRVEANHLSILTAPDLIATTLLSVGAELAASSETPRPEAGAH